MGHAAGVGNQAGARRHRETSLVRPGVTGAAVKPGGKNLAVAREDSARAEADVVDTRIPSVPTRRNRPQLWLIGLLVYFLYLMGFAFDPAKSAANLKKHGIDFVAAQALWSDPDRLEIPALSLDEPRTQVIGRIGDVVWSAFVTHRGERIRIISVRRA